MHDLRRALFGSNEKFRKYEKCHLSQQIKYASQCMRFYGNNNCWTALRSGLLYKLHFVKIGQEM